MTKRDFEAIAAHIRLADETWNDDWNPLPNVAKLHADYFEATYPRFNREQFLDACGF